jgi:hypothetical protein
VIGINLDINVGKATIEYNIVLTLGGLYVNSGIF